MSGMAMSFTAEDHSGGRRMSPERRERRVRPDPAGGPSMPAFVALVLAVAACSGGGGSPSPGSPSMPSPEPASPDVGATPMIVFVEGGGTYRSVAPAQLAGMLETKDFILVNVHVPYDGEIEATDAFIPYDGIAGRLADLPPARDATIFLYCRSGRMSAIAARTLVGLGYTNVWELDGGFDAWEAAGYPLRRTPSG